MQTAKGFLLTDENGVLISPMTDLSGVYYEVEDDNGLIARKYIYNDFPAGIKYNDGSINKLSVSNSSAFKINIQNNQKLQVRNQKGYVQDIYVSDVSVYRLSGTNYNMLQSTTYNLSDILFNYESKSAADSSFLETYDYIDVNVSTLKLTYDTLYNNLVVRISLCISNVSIIDNNINDYSQTVNTALNSCGNTTIYNRTSITNLISLNALIANLIYCVLLDISTMVPNLKLYTRISNTNVSIGIAHIENTTDKYVFYLKATSCNTFDERVLNSYIMSSAGSINSTHCQIHYDITNNKITYMKDQYCNEAPYDFKYTVQPVQVVYCVTSPIIWSAPIELHTFSNNRYLEHSKQGNIKNVKITISDYSLSKMPMFIAQQMENVNCNLSNIVFINSYNIANTVINKSDVIISCIHNTDTSLGSDFRGFISNSNIINSEIYIENISSIQNYNAIDRCYIISNTDIINSKLYSYLYSLNNMLNGTYLQLQYVEMKNSNLTEVIASRSQYAFMLTLLYSSIINTYNLKFNANWQDINLSNNYYLYGYSLCTIDSTATSNNYYLQQNLHALDISTF